MPPPQLWQPTCTRPPMGALAGGGVYLGGGGTSPFTASDGSAAGGGGGAGMHSSSWPMLFAVKFPHCPVLTGWGGSLFKSDLGGGADWARASVELPSSPNTAKPATHPGRGARRVFA